MAEIEMVDVLVDINECDIEEYFKPLIYDGGDDDATFTWTFESEQGHQVNITFRKEVASD